MLGYSSESRMSCLSLGYLKVILIQGPKLWLEENQQPPGRSDKYKKKIRLLGCLNLYLVDRFTEC